MVDISSDDFEGGLEGFVRYGKTVVDFTAAWCGPCKTMAPVIHRVAKELSVPVGIVDVDSDRGQQLSNMYRVTALPTLIMFRR